jgi:NAD(P)-dependent dehydrogenase (short-subunit alcohol dehydrogenase family)
MAKTWLITGSSRGFGVELAKAVLESGDTVVATARRPEQLDDLVQGRTFMRPRTRPGSSCDV